MVNLIEITSKNINPVEIKSNKCLKFKNPRSVVSNKCFILFFCCVVVVCVLLYVVVVVVVDWVFVGGDRGLSICWCWCVAGVGELLRHPLLGISCDRCCHCVKIQMMAAPITRNLSDGHYPYHDFRWWLGTHHTKIQIVYNLNLIWIFVR